MCLCLLFCAKIRHFGNYFSYFRPYTSKFVQSDLEVHAAAVHHEENSEDNGEVGECEPSVVVFAHELREAVEDGVSHAAEVDAFAQDVGGYGVKIQRGIFANN